MDEHCQLRIFATCDQVLAAAATALGVHVPPPTDLVRRIKYCIIMRVTCNMGVSPQRVAGLTHTQVHTPLHLAHAPKLTHTSTHAHGMQRNQTLWP